MSTLAERLRSLHHGRELLEAVAAETRLPADLRGQAAEAMKYYPCAADIDGLLASDENPLLDGWCDALAATRSILLELMRLPKDHRLGDYARWIERHFPEADYLQRTAGTGPHWAALFLDPYQAFRAAHD